MSISHSRNMSLQLLDSSGTDWVARSFGASRARAWAAGCSFRVRSKCLPFVFSELDCSFHRRGRAMVFEGGGGAGARVGAAAGGASWSEDGVFISLRDARPPRRAPFYGGRRSILGVALCK